MVTFFLGNSSQGVDEVEGLGKIRKLKNWIRKGKNVVNLILNWKRQQQKQTLKLR